MKEHWGELLCVWKGKGISMKARYVIEKNHYSDQFLSLLGHWSESVKKSYMPLFLFPHSLDSRSSTSDRSRKFWYSSCTGIFELLIKLLLLIKTPVLKYVFIHDHIIWHLLFTVLHCRWDIFIFFYIAIILYKKVNFLEISTTCSPLGNLYSEKSLEA